MSLELLAKTSPSVITAMYKYRHEVFKEGAMSVKEKELVAVAVSCVLKCDLCLETHADLALKAGATNDEIRESVLVAMYLSGPTSGIWSPIVDKYIK